MTACRSCGAPIVWARTVADKACPLDAGPDGRPLHVFGGGLVLVAESSRGIVVEADHGADGYRSHFATCATPKRWRKPR